MCAVTGTVPGPEGDPEELLTKGRSIAPLSPKLPPAGMVLPNAFGLLSKQSFKRTPAAAAHRKAQVNLESALRANCVLARSVIWPQK